MIIGPSTGWLYANNIYNIKEQEKIIKEAGANTLEVALFEDEKRIDILMNQKFKQFNNLSLHLEDYDESDSIYNQISLANKLINRLNPKCALIHPLDIPERFYIKAMELNLPLAIENMDKNNEYGFKLNELEKLITTYDLKFVFDVQHAYEHDHRMNYAKELFSLVKDRICHLHVSGKMGNINHALVCESNNKKEIIDFTGRILLEKEVPIILEGKYRNASELKEEIDFIKGELE